MHAFFLAWLIFLQSPAADHLEANPVYKELRTKGVAAGSAGAVLFPEPSMADGLDARAQEAVIKKIAGEDYTWDELVRKSQVAPQVLRLSDLANTDKKSPLREIDLWFIAYGDLDAVTSKEFLEHLTGGERKEVHGKGLTRADLAKRNIALTAEREKYEGYGSIVFNLFDRVEISAVGHGAWSRSADSALAAAKMDGRFLNDAEFPCQWRGITRDDNGNLAFGPPHPYVGGGYYLKVTRLLKPAGALFFESHTIFPEPDQWFDGANLLRSKLPVVVQSQVRAMRRELIQAGK